jgi:multidrug efflux pump subunit AcrA (membrane-fusion protein)
MKRALVLLVIVILLGAGIYGLLQRLPGNGKSGAGGITTDTAVMRDLSTVVPASGEVLPLLSSIVKSEISGRIIKIPVIEGDTVERDQILLELDRTSLETRLREAERNLEAENLRLEKSRRNYARLKEQIGRASCRERV